MYKRPEWPRVETSPCASTALARRTGNVLAVDRVDLDIQEDEFFTLLSPSGSGKSTCLRMIAGFERPDAGRVELAGSDVTNRRPTSAR